MGEIPFAKIFDHQVIIDYIKLARFARVIILSNRIKQSIFFRQFFLTMSNGSMFEDDNRTMGKGQRPGRTFVQVNY